eukprot:CAMPEP_0172684878 /NCGR_PEP_ID=MMETSP1074-20121228/19873_1 /TAXON_ID=2916 /ORGANISM="Ceratium fusus, Strain PA161109" /LENGTH=193 /DNA_ID=CAMNT_0013503955 /DNA_START=108 /DNA_END=690 /DNA_ORIENTATION=-
MELSMFQIKSQGSHRNPHDASVQHVGHRVVVEENECARVQHLCKDKFADVALVYCPCVPDPRLQLYFMQAAPDLPRSGKPGAVKQCIVFIYCHSGRSVWLPRASATWHHEKPTVDLRPSPMLVQPSMTPRELSRRCGTQLRHMDYDGVLLEAVAAQRTVINHHHTIADKSLQRRTCAFHAHELLLQFSNGVAG